jgi:hypothetical protein
MSKEYKVETKPETASPASPAAPAKPAMTMEEAIQKGIAEGIALASQMAARSQAASAPAPAPRRSRCSECGQPQMACNNEHRLTIVWPTDSRVARFFSGVKINGVRYVSNGPGHLITVPKECNVEYLVAQNEKQEATAFDGRKFARNSGSIGSGSNNFNAYKGGEFNNR